MSTKAKTCYIRSSDNSLSTVYLPDCTSVFVGRCPETNIVDTKCSRQQVRLYADYSEHTVVVQQVGTRPCGINGFKTQKNTKVIVKHNDCLEILYGKYPYRIEFNPPPINSHKTTLKKRCQEPEQSSEEIDTCIYKMQKTSDTDSISNHTSNTGSTELNSTNRQDASTSKDVLSSDSNITTINGTGNLWENIDDKEMLIYTPMSIQHRTKIAAYDMDGTLIKTKSGYVFPKDCNDWQILYPEIPGKLKQLHANGYKIVIFTNQAGLTSGKTKISDFKLKIERIVQKLGVPIQVFVAAGKHIYRKPATGMWETLVNSKNGGLSIDKSESFYVGDAAGRPKNWASGKKKDHSSVDRLMALNIGLPFQTPEEHFLGHKPAQYVLPSFNPKNISKTGSICTPPDAKLTFEEQEIVLMVGSPGSGKSHFARLYLKDYGYINRDTLGSWQKCVAALEQLLSEGKSVVVDNTNPDSSSRQRYIEVAKKRNVSVRCFLMATSAEHAKHNNRFRELTDPTHVKVSDIIINAYMKSYVAPTLAEGFKEIVEINFIPKFQDPKDQTLYEMYLLEN